VVKIVVFGDSGGPLLAIRNIINNNSMDGQQQQYVVQVGIVSFGDGCAQIGKPPVSTRISGYYQFIQNGICN
jgi:secreted trypsin-like serine protease